MSRCAYFECPQSSTKGMADGHFTEGDSGASPDAKEEVVSSSNDDGDLDDKDSTVSMESARSDAREENDVSSAAVPQPECEREPMPEPEMEPCQDEEMYAEPEAPDEPEPATGEPDSGELDPYQPCACESAPDAQPLPTTQEHSEDEEESGNGAEGAVRQDTAIATSGRGVATCGISERSTSEPTVPVHSPRTSEDSTLPEVAGAQKSSTEGLAQGSATSPNHEISGHGTAPAATNNPDNAMELRSPPQDTDEIAKEVPPVDSRMGENTSQNVQLKAIKASPGKQAAKEDTEECKRLPEPAKASRTEMQPPISTICGFDLKHLERRIENKCSFNATSPYAGVSRIRNNYWQARIQNKGTGKPKHLGYFRTEIQAAMAVRAGKLETQGDIGAAAAIWNAIKCYNPAQADADSCSNKGMSGGSNSSSTSLPGVGHGTCLEAQVTSKTDSQKTEKADNKEKKKEEETVVKNDMKKEDKKIPEGEKKQVPKDVKEEAATKPKIKVKQVSEVFTVVAKLETYNVPKMPNWRARGRPLGSGKKLLDKKVTASNIKTLAFIARQLEANVKLQEAEAFESEPTSQDLENELKSNEATAVSSKKDRRNESKDDPKMRKSQDFMSKTKLPAKRRAHVLSTIEEQKAGAAPSSSSQMKVSSGSGTCQPTEDGKPPTPEKNTHANPPSETMPAEIPWTIIPVQPIIPAAPPQLPTPTRPLQVEGLSKIAEPCKPAAVNLCTGKRELRVLTYHDAVARLLGGQVPVPFTQASSAVTLPMHGLSSSAPPHCSWDSFSQHHSMPPQWSTRQDRRYKRGEKRRREKKHAKAKRSKRALEMAAILRHQHGLEALLQQQQGAMNSMQNKQASQPEGGWVDASIAVPGDATVLDAEAIDSMRAESDWEAMQWIEPSAYLTCLVGEEEERAREEEMRRQSEWEEAGGEEREMLHRLAWEAKEVERERKRKTRSSHLYNHR